MSITFGDIDGLRDQIYEGLKLVMKLKELKMRKREDRPANVRHLFSSSVFTLGKVEVGIGRKLEDIEFLRRSLMFLC